MMNSDPRRFGTFQHSVVIWILFDYVYPPYGLHSRRASVDVLFRLRHPVTGETELVGQHAQSFLQDFVGDEQRNIIAERHLQQAQRISAED
jgi:hypothetical protein